MVIYETPGSNRDWKSRYFFLEGDGWMCHPGETDFMPVDKSLGNFGPVWYSLLRRVVNVIFFFF